MRALAVYLAVLVAIKIAMVASGRTVTLESGESFGVVVMLPLTTTFMYFMAVFSYGLTGDLAARQSMFPARLFTLPVTTGALAGWPMLYGTIAMALLWAVTRVLCSLSDANSTFRPSGRACWPRPWSPGCRRSRGCRTRCRECG